MPSECDYNAGAFRQAIEIQAEARVPDQVGGFLSTWAPASGAPTRAQITGSAGSERASGGRLVSGSSYRMITRWFRGASAAQRVVWDGREYAVRGVADPDGRRRFLEWSLSDGGLS